MFLLDPLRVFGERSGLRAKQTVMHKELITSCFARIGARIKMRSWATDVLRLASRTRMSGLAVTVPSDRLGQYFDIQVDSVMIDLHVVEVQPEARHLVMAARHLGVLREERFVCGHDERSWFVAALPDGSW